eukprot:gnl/Trimastix_PCT/744.p1 GENE.gnl/Trimastix_PCT/744~~gnl/Trimastix_PCT/744.p1  ORF type:complete len:628 (+),score=153.42 gnl/Trimastix_PCT/744:1972-3855(+)
MQVVIYRLLCANTIEEKVFNRQLVKQGLAARVVDERTPHRLFTRGELKAMMQPPPPDTPWRGDEALVASDPFLASLRARFPELLVGVADIDTLLADEIDLGSTLAVPPGGPDLRRPKRSRVIEDDDDDDDEEEEELARGPSDDDVKTHEGAWAPPLGRREFAVLSHDAYAHASLGPVLESALTHALRFLPAHAREPPRSGRRTPDDLYEALLSAAAKLHAAQAVPPDACIPTTPPRPAPHRPPSAVSPVLPPSPSPPPSPPSPPPPSLSPPLPLRRSGRRRVQRVAPPTAPKSKRRAAPLPPGPPEDEGAEGRSEGPRTRGTSKGRGAKVKVKAKVKAKAPPKRARQRRENGEGEREEEDGGTSTAPSASAPEAPPPSHSQHLAPLPASLAPCVHRLCTLAHHAIDGSVVGSSLPRLGAPRVQRLIIALHGLDAPALRTAKAAQYLGSLASLPWVSLVATADHHNAPLLWGATPCTRWFYAAVPSTARHGALEAKHILPFLPRVSGPAAQHGILSVRHVLSDATRWQSDVLRELVRWAVGRARASDSWLPEAELHRACAALPQHVGTSVTKIRTAMQPFIDRGIVALQRQGAELLYSVAPERLDELGRAFFPKDDTEDDTEDAGGPT